MATQAQVDAVLDHPENFIWSVQGLGMLRTYLDLDGVERLHIWDPQAMYEDVSTIHDHPWDFTSTVHYGEMTNIRFLESHGDIRGITQHEMFHSQIFCGEGGGLRGDQTQKIMDQMPDEWFERGESYSMEATEIHESYPTPGAVTVIRRKFVGDRDLANVFWKQGDWVTAEPRAATKEEIRHFISKARHARRESF